MSSRKWALDDMGRGVSWHFFAVFLNLCLWKNRELKEYKYKNRRLRKTEPKNPPNFFFTLVGFRVRSGHEGQGAVTGGHQDQSAVLDLYRVTS